MSNFVTGVQFYVMSYIVSCGGINNLNTLNTIMNTAVSCHYNLLFNKYTKLNKL